jgi:drug/metabolite transporter (DMT)-like permease
LVLLFFSFGIIVPIIVDLTILGTLINIYQIVGIALLFISFYLGNRPDSGEKKGISLKFIVFCIIGFLFNGSVMATAKLHQGAMPGIDVQVFVTFGFTVSVITSAILFVFFHIKESKKEKISYSYMFKAPKYYVSVFGSAVTTAFGNILMLVIAGLVPAAIQFPLMNGGTCLITAILSIFFFKEKFTKKTAIVFIVGIAALAIINL